MSDALTSQRGQAPLVGLHLRPSGHARHLTAQLPLAVGANLLALLGALIPLRIVTILTLGIVFLAVGASAIGFTVVIVMVSKATSRLGVLFNPAQFVDARPGWATWFILAALVCDVGALLFLLIAMPPAKAKPLPPADLGVRECVSNCPAPLTRQEIRRH